MFPQLRDVSSSFFFAQSSDSNSKFVVSHHRPDSLQEKTAFLFEPADTCALPWLAILLLSACSEASFRVWPLGIWDPLNLEDQPRGVFELRDLVPRSVPDPEVQTFHATSSAVPQFLTPFLFFVYHHHPPSRHSPQRSHYVRLKIYSKQQGPSPWETKKWSRRYQKARIEVSVKSLHPAHQSHLFTFL